MANKVDLPYDVGDQDRGDADELVEDGTYLCEIARATHLEGKNGSADAVGLGIKIVAANEENLSRYVGASFFDTISLHENVGWKMAQFLDAIAGRKVKGKSIDLDSFIGKRMTCQVFTDIYNNQSRSRVKAYLGVDKFRGEEAASSSATDGDSNESSDSEEVSI